jgi:hypothetical protein
MRIFKKIYIYMTQPESFEYKEFANKVCKL